LNISSNNSVENELLGNRFVLVAGILTITIPISFLFQYFNLNDKILFVLFSFMPLIFIYVIFTRKEIAIVISISEKEPAQKVLKIDTHHIDELLIYMKEEKPFLNQNLTLPELGIAMGWSRSFLSKAINEKLGKNFYDFVNEFRLNYVLLRIKKREYKDHTLEYIAKNSGFKSYVSFYRRFKKSENETPSELIKRIENP